MLLLSITQLIINDSIEAKQAGREATPDMRSCPYPNVSYPNIPNISRRRVITTTDFARHSMPL
jgi:hypothetical protein